MNVWVIIRVRFSVRTIIRIPFFENVVTKQVLTFSCDHWATVHCGIVNCATVCRILQWDVWKNYLYRTCSTPCYICTTQSTWQDTSSACDNIIPIVTQ